MGVLIGLPFRRGIHSILKRRGLTQHTENRAVKTPAEQQPNKEKRHFNKWR
jgi:hypothetical protein